jgi:hypothetical protein
MPVSPLTTLEDRPGDLLVDLAWQVAAIPGAALKPCLLREELIPPEECAGEKKETKRNLC